MTVSQIRTRMNMLALKMSDSLIINITYKDTTNVNIIGGFGKADVIFWCNNLNRTYLMKANAMEAANIMWKKLKNGA